MSSTTFGAEITALGITPHHWSEHLACDLCTITAETWVVDIPGMTAMRLCRPCFFSEMGEL
jgi:hypothetical protein